MSQRLRPGNPTLNVETRDSLRKRVRPDQLKVFNLVHLLKSIEDDPSTAPAQSVEGPRRPSHDDNIRTVEKLHEHKGVATTMTYTLS